MERNIFIFYHVYIYDESLCYTILSEQLYSLLMSNLMSQSKKIFINVCGSGDKSIVNEIISSYNFYKNIDLNFVSGLVDERVTSFQMKNFCDDLEDDSYILYLHTKGISHIGTPKFITTKSWRLMMEYFNIFKWKDCVAKLSEGYDSCGILWKDESHYSGTFFWVKSSLIKNIDMIWFTPLSPDGRHSVEFMLSKVEHNFYDFHYQLYGFNKKNLYYEINLPSEYIR